MLKVKLKLHDKGVFDQIKKQKAKLRAGFLGGDMYEAIDEPFYANELRKSDMDYIGYDYGKRNPKPRKFGKRKAIPVAQVALANEYGVPERKVPPRPFMDKTFRWYNKKWLKTIRGLIYDTMDLKATLEDMGPTIVDDIQSVIKDFDNPPNAPSTIKNKGFNDPLIDSGQMLYSVRYEVK